MSRVYSFLMYAHSLIALSSDESMRSAGLRRLDILETRRGVAGENIMNFKFDGPQLDISCKFDDESVVDDREISEEEFEFDF